VRERQQQRDDRYSAQRDADGSAQRHAVVVVHLAVKQL
jgi:hypothetical protein